MSHGICCEPTQNESLGTCSHFNSFESYCYECDVITYNKIDERLNAIEKQKFSEFCPLTERIDNVEMRLENHMFNNELLIRENINNIHERIDNLEKERDLGVERIKKLEEMQNAFISTPNIIWAKYNKTPHKCPLCGGRGYKYDANIDKESCHACEGTGVLWG